MSGLIGGLGAGAGRTAAHRLLRHLGIASKSNPNENAIQAGMRAAREKAAARAQLTADHSVGNEPHAPVSTGHELE